MKSIYYLLLTSTAPNGAISMMMQNGVMRAEFILMFDEQNFSNYIHRNNVMLH